MEKWHLKLSQPKIILMNFNIMILCLCMLILQVKKTLCHPNGNKWRSTRFLMAYWVDELSGTTMINKSKRKITSMMHGQVELLSKEVLSILHQWKPNFLGTMNPTTLQNNFCLRKSKKKNGKSSMRKTDHLTLFLLVSRKCDTFLTTID